MRCSTRQCSLREIPSYNTKTVRLCTTLDPKEHFHISITSVNVLDTNCCRLSNFKADVNIICVAHRHTCIVVKYQVFIVVPKKIIVGMKVITVKWFITILSTAAICIQKKIFWMDKNMIMCFHEPNEYAFVFCSSKCQTD